MYVLDRTQKGKIVTICLCIHSFALSVFSYAKGGDELLRHGFMNQAFFSIRMIACFACGIVLLRLSALIDALQKDIAGHLKSLEKRGGIRQLLFPAG